MWVFAFTVTLTSLYGDVSTGGGVEYNLNHAATDELSESSLFAGANALLGWGIDGERASGWLDASFDANRYLDFPEFSAWVTRVTGGLTVPLTLRLSANLTPSAAWHTYPEDPARSGPSVGGSAGLRWRTSSWLALSLRGGYTWRDARDAVFGYSMARAIATAVLTPRRWLEVAGRGFAERSSTVLYLPTTTEIQPRRGRRSSVFGETLNATQEHALTTGVGVDLTLSSEVGLYLIAAYELLLVEATTSSYTSPAVWTRVGYRWE